MSTTSGKLVYFFGAGRADGGSEVKHLVGGKGASLAEMTRAGLNVPPGFTISAECCALYFQAAGKWAAGLEEEVRANLARLEEIIGRPFGRGGEPLLVAVRSGAAHSMPGMMDTVLNVGRQADGEPWKRLRRAIDAVFDSWNSERAVLYRKHHGIDGLLGTAVTVQVMCPADISGVLFTANPVDPSREEMLVESVAGLGEALVLGKVTPNRFVLDKRALRVLERVLAPDAASATLNDDQLVELGRLGLRVEAYFKEPCDIEWALSAGRFFLLQARPIRRAEGVSPLMAESIGELTPPARPDVERERVRQEEIATLRARAEPTGTVWSRYNLSEVLPEPTPMTWAIVRRFMSGRGGFGLMYRDLGFDPDPALDEEGVFDLVCGRPYCNLSREPRLYFRILPFEHNFAALRAAPHKAIYPQPTLNAARAGWRFWLLAPYFIPKAMIQMISADQRQRDSGRTLAQHLREELFPAFAAETAQGTAEDLTRLDGPALLERLEHWTRRTLLDFARDSLKPTALAGLAMAKVERMLTPSLGPERTRTAIGELTMGVRPDPEADLPGAINDLVADRIDGAAFIKRFGHRGSQEMELAKPRWAEAPPSELRPSGSLGRAWGDSPMIMGLSPHARPPLADGHGSEILAELPAEKRAALRAELQTLHTFLALRETAKHYLMMGYALIRRVLVELDRRYRLDGGIFFLTPEELPRLIANKNLRELIAQRRRRRHLALSLEVPQILFSDDLEAIGRLSTAAVADTLQGVALSAGVAEGPALVLLHPAEAANATEPYILVCPSTDPAWMPLFVNARGLVMETGGVLSHGAIVAREFGLPAVAGLADVQRRLKSGQRLRVDGGTGTVTVLTPD
jgi:pyruvate,water dikinase